MLKKSLLIIFFLSVGSFCFADTVEWKLFQKDISQGETATKNKGWFEEVWIESGPCTRSYPCYTCFFSFLEFLPKGKFRFWTEEVGHCAKILNKELLAEGYLSNKGIKKSSYQEGIYKIINENTVELSADWQIPQQDSFIKKQN